MFLPTRHASAPNRLEQGGSWSSGHCLTEGDPFLQLPPLGKNRGHPPPEYCPLNFAAALFSPRGSLSSQKPGASAAIPALPGGAEAGAEHMESGGWAWRGAELSAPIPPALRSVPIAHGPMAERKMAARSATDSHVPRRCRCTPPPPLAESRTQRDAEPRVASPPPEYRTVRTRREGPDAESQFSPRSAPNPGAGVALREPRKTFLRATCTRSGHWACAVLRPGHTSSPGFSPNSAGPAGGGVGRRWGREGSGWGGPVAA